MIDSQTIQRIFEAAEITEVVQDFVSLKKRGVNYTGLCPFHNEKTPSFSVSPAKGIYKCFGCGKAGNAVNFVMEHEKVSYPEALKYLAKKYHIEIVEKELTSEEQKEQNQRESLLIINAYAQKYFSRILHEHNDGRAIGLSYFRERNFRDDIIHKFQLGYCLEQKRAFTDEALKQGYKLEYLTISGLTVDKESYQFDRFSGRVMFPIHSLSGRVIAFGARTLKNDKKIAKYLNSPESEIYHKSNVLYGIYFAKQSIIQHNKCYLTEGYTDVISLFQAGIENVVASSGTSLTVNQIRLIKRFTLNLTILYDGDEAGIKASLRGIDLVLEEEMNVKVLLLPNGEDPDSIAKKMSATELIAYIETHEEDFIAFKSRLLKSESEHDPIKRATLIGDIVRTIAVIPDGIKRAEYAKECSIILNIKEELLYSEIAKVRLDKHAKNHKAESQQKNQVPKNDLKNIEINNPFIIDSVHVFEKERIRLLLSYANEKMKILPFEQKEDSQNEEIRTFIIQEITNDDLEFSHPLYATMFNEFTELVDIDERYFIHHEDAEIASLAAELLSSPHILSTFWKRGDNLIDERMFDLNIAIPKLILSYKDQHVRKILKEIESKLQTITDQDELMSLLGQYKQFKEINMAISRQLGDRIIIR